MEDASKRGTDEPDKQTLCVDILVNGHVRVCSRGSNVIVDRTGTRDRAVFGSWLSTALQPKSLLCMYVPMGWHELASHCQL